MPTTKRKRKQRRGPNPDEVDVMELIAVATWVDCLVSGCPTRSGESVQEAADALHKMAVGYDTTPQQLVDAIYVSDDPTPRNIEALIAQATEI